MKALGYVKLTVVVYQDRFVDKKKIEGKNDRDYKHG